MIKAVSVVRLQNYKIQPTLRNLGVRKKVNKPFAIP